MAAEAISKPELALLQSVLSLAGNPAAPINIKKDPVVFDRLMQSDFANAWELVGNINEVAGKNPPTRPSVNAGINKVRRFYKYEKPYCDEEVEACTTDICDVTNTTTEPVGYLAVDIDQCASKSWTTSIEEFNSLLETPSERRADKLRRAAYALKINANANIITNLYSSISDYADGTDGLTATKTITMISDKGDILPVSMAKIRKEYRDSNFKGDYVIFGGSTVAQYFDVKELRLSPEGKMGVMGTLADFPMLYDSQFDTVFQEEAEDTASHGVVVPIGSFFVDVWNQYTGYQRMIDPNYIYTTINIDGLLYDYSMKFDECDRVWKEMLTLHYGLGAIPDSIYCDGKGLIKHYLFTCGAFDCESL